MQNRNTVQKFALPALCVLAAYLCRLLGMYDIFPAAMGLMRSLLYIGLYAVWGISLRSRIIQKQARRYLTAVAALMVFWFVARTLKFHVVPAEQYPTLTRMLWYLYYLGMLFLPLFAVLIALSLGKPEDYRLPKPAYLLYLPTAVLFLLVMTNDLHQLVFTFPETAAVWTDRHYGYGVGYYFVFGWILLCALTTLLIMIVKCRIPGSRKRILLPALPIALLLGYSILYGLRVKWASVVLGDFTAFFCLMYAATFELCIGCRFIQSNTHYRELFDASTVAVWIADRYDRVYLASNAAKPLDARVMRQLQNGPVMLKSGVRLSRAPIHKGQVIWAEDMSPLLQVLHDLNEAKEDLQDSNGILEEENAVKAKEAHIAEQDRLYRIIRRDTARQIEGMDALIRQAEQTDSPEQKRKLLQKMLVLGAYLKRRSNLVFLADKAESVEATELSLTFRESLDNLELCGVTCGFGSALTGTIPTRQLMAMYDFFEEIVERSFDCMESLTVYVGEQNGVFLTIRTDSAAVLSDLASQTVAVTQDEDGEWRLTYDAGGGEI